MSTNVDDAARDTVKCRILDDGEGHPLCVVTRERSEPEARIRAGDIIGGICLLILLFALPWLVAAFQ